MESNLLTVKAIIGVPVVQSTTPTATPRFLPSSLLHGKLTLWRGSVYTEHKIHCADREKEIQALTELVASLPRQISRVIGARTLGRSGILVRPNRTL